MAIFFSSQTCFRSFDRLSGSRLINSISSPSNRCESAINDDGKDTEKDSNDDNDTEKDNDDDDNDDDDNDDDAVKKSHSRLN